MKNKLKAILLITIMSVASIGTTVLALNNKKSEVVNATDLDAYYSSVDTSSSSKLHADLKKLLSVVTFDDYDGLWDIYEKVYFKEEGIVFDFYCNTSKHSYSNVSSLNKYEGSGLNREHCIPSSYWIKDLKQKEQGADPFIVLPADAWTNSCRGNDPFGNVSGTPTKTSQSGYWKIGSGDSTYGYSGKVFEPHDSLKGNFARIYFYAATKYDTTSWTEVSQAGAFFNGSSTNYGFTDGALKLLKEWHELDPVDEWEKTVNDRLETTVGLRNPYIDHPEYADIIWYGGTTSNKTLESIKITNSPAKTQYFVGDTFNPEGLTVTAYFDDSSSLDVTNSVTWTPTTLSLETTSVTASYTYGSVTKRATYNGITVKEIPTIGSITVSGTPNKKIYTAGESFDPTGLTVTALYSDNTTAVVTDSVIWTPNPLTVGTTTVTGTFSGHQCTVSDITVVAPSAVEGTVIFDFSEMGLTNAQEVSSFEENPVSLYFAKNTNSLNPKYYTSGAAVRLYGGGLLTISSSSLPIVKIGFEYTSDKTANTLSANVGTLSSKVWTGNSKEIIFAVGGTSGHIKFATITVTYADYELEAYNWANNFLNKTGGVCNAKGNTDLTALTTVWSEVNSSYASLSTNAKNMVKNSSLISDSTYKTAVNNAFKRYSFIVDKYDSLTDFIGDVRSSNNSYLYKIKSDNYYVVIIASIVFVSLVSVALIFVKKKPIR